MRRNSYNRVSASFLLFDIVFWMMFALILAGFVFVGYQVYQYQTHPELIGEYYGKIYKGFQEGAK